MTQLAGRRAILDAMKQELAVTIKLDIAQTLRHHPHLEASDSVRAYATLANDATVDRLIKDIARDEVEAAIERGDLPPAAIIHLAGYRQNPIAEG